MWTVLAERILTRHPWEYLCKVAWCAAAETALAEGLQTEWPSSYRDPESKESNSNEGTNKKSFLRKFKVSSLEYKGMVKLSHGMNGKQCH